MRSFGKITKYEMQKQQKVGLLLKKYLKGMKFLKYPVKIRNPVYVVPYDIKSERDRILKGSNFINNIDNNKFSKEYIDTLCTMLYCNFEHYTFIRSKINSDNIQAFIKYKNLYDKEIEENIQNERKKEEDEFKEEIKRLFLNNHKNYKRNLSEFKSDEKNKNEIYVKSIDNKISCINDFYNKKTKMSDDTNSFKTQCPSYNDNNFLVTGETNKNSMNTISTNIFIKDEKKCKQKEHSNFLIKNTKSFISNKKPTHIYLKTNQSKKHQKAISFYNPVKTTDLISYNSIENNRSFMNNNPKSMDEKVKNTMKRNKTLDQNFQTIENMKSNKKKDIRSVFIKSFPLKFEKFSKYKLKFENSLNRDIMKIPDKIRVKNLLLNGEYFVKKHRESLVQQKFKKFNILALKEKKKLFENDDI